MSASRALFFAAALAVVAPSMAPAVAFALAQSGGAAADDDPPPADDWGAEGEGADQTPADDRPRETPPDDGRPIAGDAPDAGVADAGRPDAGSVPKSGLPKGSVGLGLPEPAPPRQIDLTTEMALKEHLEARARYLRAGDTVNAEVELGLLIESRVLVGARNVIVASASLMHEADVARKEGHLEQAIQLAEHAATLSPDLSSVHWLRARLYFEQDWSQGARIGAALVALTKTKLERFRNTVTFASNVLLGWSLAVFATMVLFTLIQVFKYVRYPAHDVARLLPSWFGAGEGVLLFAIALVGPLVLGLGLPVTVVLAVATIYAYQTVRERAVSIAIFVLLAAAPGALYLFAPFVTFHGSIVDAMETVMSEAFASDAETQLANYLRTTGKSDLEGAQLLAHRYRMRGDLAAAEIEYRRALAAQPANSALRNNLGTLLYLLGREEAALGTFQAAAAANDRAEPMLNLASMLLDQSRFDEAKATIERARNVDPALAARYTGTESGRPTVEKLLYAELGQSVLWERLFEVDSDARMDVATALWRRIGGATPPIAMPVVVFVAAALAMLLARRAERLALSTGCPKCGVPAKRDAPATYCDQCQSIFLKAVAVEPMLRIAKEEDVRSFQRRRRWTERLLSLVAGAGHMFSGSPIAGAFFALFLAGALASMRFPEGFLVHPWSVGFDPSAGTFQLGVAAVLAGILVLASVRSSLK